MKFVDIKNDIAFRKIFGNEKKSICLISFINAVLELEELNRVAEVTILNPYLLPHVVGEKVSIIDIRATDQKGRQFVIEMQVADKSVFDKEAEKHNWNKEELMAYDSASMRDGDAINKIERAVEIGIEKFSLKMLKESMPINLVSKFTELTDE